MKPAFARSRRGMLLLLSVYLSAAPAAQAQWSHDATAQAYFVTGDTTFNDPLDPNGGSFNFQDILVGKNNRTDFETLPGSFTLTLTGDFNIFEESGTYTYPDGGTYGGVHVFGNHKIDTYDVDPITSYPYIWTMTLHDSSQATVRGGKVEQQVTVLGSATLNANGAWMRNVYGGGSSKVNMEGSQGLVGLADNSEGTLSNSNVGLLNLAGSAKATLTNVNGMMLDASGNSTVDFQSGTYGEVRANDASVITLKADTVTQFLQMTGDAVMYLHGLAYEAHLRDDSTLHIETGAEAHLFTFNDSVDVIINGGELDRFASLVEGTITLKAGALEGYAYLLGDSVLNLEGGSIEDAELFSAGSGSLFNFYGQSLLFSNPTAGTESGYGYIGVFYDLSWVQADGTLMETRFFDRDGDVGNLIPPGVTFTMVPEPGGVLLLTGGLAVAGFRRRRR